jgi:hypothetical protein
MQACRCRPPEHWSAARALEMRVARRTPASAACAGSSPNIAPAHMLNGRGRSACVPASLVGCPRRFRRRICPQPQVRGGVRLQHSHVANNPFAGQFPAGPRGSHPPFGGGVYSTPTAVTHELQSTKHVSLWRPLAAAHALSYAAAPEFLDSGAQSSSMRVRETLLRLGANGALRPARTGRSNAAQDSPRGIAKTRSEEPIEMGEIGKANLKCNIGDPPIAFAVTRRLSAWFRRSSLTCAVNDFPVASNSFC